MARRPSSFTVANAYARDWLEKRVATTVQGVLAGIVGRSLAVRLVVPVRMGRDAWPYGLAEVAVPRPPREALLAARVLSRDLF